MNGEPVNRPLDELPEAELQAILTDNACVARLRVFVLQTHRGAEATGPRQRPAGQPRAEESRIPAELADAAFNTLDEAQTGLLALNLIAMY